MKPQKITNMRGFICRSTDGKMFFRQYNADHFFRDFEIAHYDLEIEIVDSDAYAYQKGQTWVIDYGPNTPGIDPGADCDDSEPEEEDG